jgi:SAM-dependent methyltransferase
MTPVGDLQGLREDWEDLARLDPLWAILSDDRRRNGGWRLDDFLRTGEVEIARLMSVAGSLGLPQRHDRALDFGCGVGRLTRALTMHFGECVGVDISTQMLETARKVNADRPNCVFIHNGRSDLSGFEDRSFDLVYTNIVLQHVPNRLSAVRYIPEFVRVLRPLGLLVFQIPHKIPLRRALQPRQRLYHLLRRLGIRPDQLYRRLGLHPIRMIDLPEAQAIDIVVRAGGEILEVRPLTLGSTGIEDRTYFVTRRDGS